MASDVRRSHSHHDARPDVRSLNRVRRRRCPGNRRAIRTAGITVLPLIPERRRRRAIPGPSRGDQHLALHRRTSNHRQPTIHRNRRHHSSRRRRRRRRARSIGGGHRHLDRRAYVRRDQRIRGIARAGDPHATRAGRITTLPLDCERRRRIAAPRPDRRTQRLTLDRRPRHTRQTSIHRRSARRGHSRRRDRTRRRHTSDVRRSHSHDDARPDIRPLNRVRRRRRARNRRAVRTARITILPLIPERRRRRTIPRPRRGDQHLPLHRRTSNHRQPTIHRNRRHHSSRRRRRRRRPSTIRTAHNHNQSRPDIAGLNHIRRRTRPHDRRTTQPSRITILPHKRKRRRRIPAPGPHRRTHRLTLDRRPRHTRQTSIHRRSDGSGHSRRRNRTRRRDTSRVRRSDSHDDARPEIRALNRVRRRRRARDRRAIRTARITILPLIPERRRRRTTPRPRRRHQHLPLHRRTSNHRQPTIHRNRRHHPSRRRRRRRRTNTIRTTHNDNQSRPDIPGLNHIRRRTRPHDRRTSQPTRITILPHKRKRRRRIPAPGPHRRTHRLTLDRRPRHTRQTSIHRRSQGRGHSRRRNRTRGRHTSRVRRSHSHDDPRPEIRPLNRVRRRRRARDRRAIRTARITILPLIPEPRRRRTTPGPRRGDQHLPLHRRTSNHRQPTIHRNRRHHPSRRRRRRRRPSTIGTTHNRHDARPDIRPLNHIRRRTRPHDRRTTQASRITILPHKRKRRRRIPAPRPHRHAQRLTLDRRPRHTRQTSIHRRRRGKVVEHVLRERLEARVGVPRVSVAIESPRELQRAGVEHSGSGRRRERRRISFALMLSTVEPGPGEQPLDLRATGLSRGVPFVADEPCDGARLGEPRAGEPGIGKRAGRHLIVACRRRSAEAARLATLQQALGSRRLEQYENPPSSLPGSGLGRASCCGTQRSTDIRWHIGSGCSPCWPP